MTEAKTDWELLELAAKAAGIRLYAHRGSFYLHYVDDRDACAPWNPLTDDGASRRLEVKLRITVDQSWKTKVHVEWRDGHSMMSLHVDCLGDEDRAFATRMAVLRAAAAIGEAMK